MPSLLCSLDKYRQAVENFWRIKLRNEDKDLCISAEDHDVCIRCAESSFLPKIQVFYAISWQWRVAWLFSKATGWLLPECKLAFLSTCFELWRRQPN